MPPLTKTCPKKIPSHKGGSLCVKDAFAKKFFGAGRGSAGGALASVLRKHSTEGRTPDAVERCVRRCAGSRPPRGTGTCRPDSELRAHNGFFPHCLTRFERALFSPLSLLTEKNTGNFAETGPPLQFRCPVGERKSIGSLNSLRNGTGNLQSRIREFS